MGAELATLLMVVAVVVSVIISVVWSFMPLPFVRCPYCRHNVTVSYRRRDPKSDSGTEMGWMRHIFCLTCWKRYSSRFNTENSRWL
jgi:DNA-directed RNA polymerase subunit RPC12/RpoP